MMNFPLVSIIVPVYNAEAYLEQCIISILNQDYRKLEVIVVNDGSSDHSLQILQSFSAQDNRLQILNKSNEGVSAARNEGLRVAQGEFVMFVDADDWLDLQTVSRCVRKIQQNNADVCLFAYMREFKNSSVPKYLYNSDKLFVGNECKQLQRRMIGPIGSELSNPGMLDSFGTIWGKIYRRSLLTNVRFIDLNIIGTAEDTLFNCFAFQNVSKAIYMHEPFYHYRKFNSKSETKKYKTHLYQQWNRLFEYMHMTNSTENGEQALNNRIALSMIGLGLNECVSKASFIAKRNQIKMILNQPHYRRAYQNLTFLHFPLCWKIFFFSAKYKFYTLYLLLSLSIHTILERK